VCFYNSYAQCAINTAAVDEAPAYISCAKEILFSGLESDFGKTFDKEFMLQSKEDDFYKSVLTVGMDEALNLLGGFKGRAVWMSLTEKYRNSFGCLFCNMEKQAV